MPLHPPQPTAPRLLAFDTATEQLALALHADGRRWHLSAAGGAAASATLLPQVQGMLTEAGLAMADLQAIAFGCGPGAFTGLRTACAVAQGLAFGLGLPVLAIDSLLIVAEDARLQVTPGADRFDIGVAMDARMGEAYAAAYRWQSGAWTTLRAPALLTPAALRVSWAALDLQAVAGSAWAALAATLPAPEQALLLPRENDRAAALLRLALAAAAAGTGRDAAQALPLYLRDKVALTTAEREAARAVASVSA